MFPSIMTISVLFNSLKGTRRKHRAVAAFRGQICWTSVLQGSFLCGERFSVKYGSDGQSSLRLSLCSACLLAFGGKTGAQTSPSTERRDDRYHSQHSLCCALLLLLLLLYSVSFSCFSFCVHLFLDPPRSLHRPFSPERHYAFRIPLILVRVL